jgi:hypothetical protein
VFLIHKEKTLILFSSTLKVQSRLPPEFVRLSIGEGLTLGGLAYLVDYFSLLAKQKLIIFLIA